MDNLWPNAICRSVGPQKTVAANCFVVLLGRASIPGGGRRFIKTLGIPIKSTLNPTKPPHIPWFYILHSLISSHHHLCWLNPMIFPEFGNYSLARPLYIAPVEIWSTQRYTQHLNTLFSGDVATNHLVNQSVINDLRVAT